MWSLERQTYSDNYHVLIPYIKPLPLATISSSWIKFSDFSKFVYELYTVYKINHYIIIDLFILRR